MNYSVKLIGLEIRNWNENGVWIENASFLEMIDCEIHHVFYGVGVGNGTHDFEFTRVVVHHFNLYGFDVSPSGGDDCYNGIFNDCIAHDGVDLQQNVDGFALGHGNQHSFEFNRCITYNVFDGFDISSRETKLNRCLAYQCWNGCYKLWQDKILMVNCVGYAGSNAVVELDWDEEPGASTLRNCTFFGAESFIVWVENANDTLKMFNCILAGGENIGLAFEQRDASTYIGDYNLFQNNNADRAIAVGYEDEFSLEQVYGGAWTTYSGQDAHSLVTNSAIDIFIDPLNFDFHLLENSIAVNSGTNLNAPLEDYEGNQRSLEEGIDMGAFEYQTPTSIYDRGHLNRNAKCLKLFQNFPNPFNLMTFIKYELSKQSFVQLKITDIMGREIRTWMIREHLPGVHHIEWAGLNNQGKPVASNIYFYAIRINGEMASGKLLLRR